MIFEPELTCFMIFKNLHNYPLAIEYNKFGFIAVLKIIRLHTLQPCFRGVMGCFCGWKAYPSLAPHQQSTLG